MKSLLDFDILVNGVFYRGWHILEYIEKHPDMDELEKEAVCATIMQALVEKKLVNPDTQSLDINNLSIVEDVEHFRYQENPNICGFPLWLKEKMRHKSVKISAGIPIALFLAKPASKLVRYCVYDQNYAMSAVFDKFTIYDAIYDSPTRKVRLEETRPFIETEINGELYLIDTLTKRILKSSWFKERFNFQATHTLNSDDFDAEQRKEYKKMTREENHLPDILSIIIDLKKTFGLLDIPNNAEYEYEQEMTRITSPESWEEYERLEKEKEDFFANPTMFMKRKPKKS